MESVAEGGAVDEEGVFVFLILFNRSFADSGVKDGILVDIGEMFELGPEDLLDLGLVIVGEICARKRGGKIVDFDIDWLCLVFEGADEVDDGEDDDKKKDEDERKDKDLSLKRGIFEKVFNKIHAFIIA